MALLASDIAFRARSTLLDPSGNYWTDAEILSYIIGATNQIIAIKPDAVTNNVALTLSPGVVQLLPTNATTLSRVIANGAGTPVVIESMAEFARTNPNWVGASPGPTQRVFYDPRTPQPFWVFPQASSGMTLVALIGIFPTAPTSLSGTVNLPNWYDAALWAFVVGMAYAKNSKRQDMVKSKFFMDLFFQFMGVVVPGAEVAAAKIDDKGVA